ncbi:Por secretion system C-terminal sorting domain-containing protein [Flavobacteriaceae bacterium MAR_2010_188]|nr:Por secretion system C-terminal sorting domain-containing protein [Flavobacteriaceae bacterium MAR_2010_188]
MTQKLHSKTFLIIFLLVANFMAAQSVFINEIHYDNDGGDLNEGLEIAGPAGTDLSDYSVVLYNGNGGGTYGSAITFVGLIPDQQGGYGTVSTFLPTNGLQNGAPDGLALIGPGNVVIQFLSYEGSFTAVGGPADGMVSTDIGVFEDAEVIGYSLQLSGTGNAYTDFAWQVPMENTFGSINTGQDFGGQVIDPDPEPDPNPSTTNGLVFINEIHYDNGGADTGEAIEVAGLAGINLDGYSIELYNGNGGALYNSTTLSGVIENQESGYGTISFQISGIQNGAPDGVALVGPEGLIQFLSYEGTFVAVGGSADGVLSRDIGISESGSGGTTTSLQLVGEGSYYEDFTWTEQTSSFASPNPNQKFIAAEPVLWINEFHYDNDGTDAGEAIEIAGTAGTDLSNYALLLYNGNNGSLYNTMTLSGTIPNQQGGYGTMDFEYPTNGIQNGSPDGIALINIDGDEVIQFLSYEGSFPAIGGAADGLSSTDIGVSEPGNTTIGYSLQLIGEGQSYDAFTWAEPMANTFGEINTSQSFGGDVVDPDPEVFELITIAEARDTALGTKVWIEGTLTVSDQFGNTAYIQDETGGIAIFSDMVTAEGLYQIGDQLKVIGTLSAFNNQIQISDLEVVEFLGQGSLIEPITITLAQIEDYRGQLVRINDVNFLGSDPILFGNSNFVISDETATGELRIDADVDDLVGKTKPDYCQEVVGIVGRYRELNQLLPRQASDLPCAEEYNPVYPGSEISKELTFEVAAWNIEWFGSSSNSPASSAADSDAVQKEAVKEILLGLNADAIGVEEITDIALFAEMIGEMEGYGYVLSDAVSYPNDTSGESQHVGLVYKTDVIDIVETKVLLETIHPYYNGGDDSYLSDYPVEDHTRFYASGRLPFMVTANATIEGQTEEMNFVVLHARANTGSDQDVDYAMRRYDVEVLKDSLDAYYPKDNLFIIGDFNDDVDETVANGVSTTQSSYFEYVNDADDYTVLTATLSEMGFRSTISYPDMIDHIMVSNELVDNYIEGSATVHYEFYTADYAYTASDHFPVSVRMVLVEEDDSCGENGDKVLVCHNGNSLCISKNALPGMMAKGAVMGSCEADALFIYVSPNPAINNTTVYLSGLSKGKATLSVYDLSGNVKLSKSIVIPDESTFEYPLNISQLAAGVYIVKVQNNKGDSVYTKLIIL